jgi:hypothetical protein
MRTESSLISASGVLLDLSGGDVKSDPKMSSNQMTLRRPGMVTSCSQASKKVTVPERD